MHQRGRNNNFLASSHAEETIKKRNEATAKRTKKISCYDTQGRLLKTYRSAGEAAIDKGISESRIRQIAAGYELTAGGFAWRYGAEKNIDFAKKLQHKRERYKLLMGKPVTQYNMNGKRLAIFPTLKDASAATGVNRSDLTNCIKGKRASALGYLWREGHGGARIDTSGVLTGESLRSIRKKKAVAQYTKDGRFIRNFESVKAAAVSIGVNNATLSGALHGASRYCGGFNWKFVKVEE
ncbi:hypothetical protein GCM10023313_38930 [Mucilaginibacter defluvii]|uniref:Nuclease-associated modular DNA-binding 1 domain-containing protein n=2 Tax=Mucilaginibacter defluvii TaxID=1196019 RepID=A0ABP9G6Z9_9SPHI